MCDRLNVAFLGALFIPKGMNTLYDLINNSSGIPVNWYLYGWITHQYKIVFKNAYVHGGYKTILELYDLLDYHNIDLVIMPGECPESFSYTMSEIWNYGLPILCSDRGALESRMVESDFKYGWVCQLNEFKDKLIYLNDNYEEIVEKKNNLLDYKPKTIKDMCNDYKDLYAMCI